MDKVLCVPSFMADPAVDLVVHANFMSTLQKSNFNRQIYRRNEKEFSALNFILPKKTHCLCIAAPMRKSEIPSISLDIWNGKNLIR
jgi:hypothetical protein